MSSEFVSDYTKEFDNAHVEAPFHARTTNRCECHLYHGRLQHAGCTSPEEPTETAVFQELYDQGIDRYLGVFTPATSQALPNGTIQYSFSEEGAPLCYTGQPYSVFTRDGSSNDLLIFTQGGGVCGPQGCAAVTVGLPLIPFGILDPIDPGNPAVSIRSVFRRPDVKMRALGSMRLTGYHAWQLAREVGGRRDQPVGPISARGDTESIPILQSFPRN